MDESAVGGCVGTLLGAQAASFDAVWVDRAERVWPFPDTWSSPNASTLTDAVRLAFVHHA